jgi:hypothetical protein
MCANLPSLEIVQLCKQTQEADRKAQEALQKLQQQNAPKPRNAEEAVEMAGGADHPVRWVRGKDGILYAISDCAPDVYKTTAKPNPKCSQPVGSPSK